jgi:hypothetical protein
MTADVPLVKSTRFVALGAAAKADRCSTPAIVSSLSREHGFRATQAMVDWDGSSDSVRLTSEVMSVLRVRKGATIGFTPVDAWEPVAEKPARRRTKAAKATSKRRVARR